MANFDSIDPELIYALFKGEPGTRKSTAALSFPGPQYWFSWDRKMSGIVVPFKKWGLPTSHLEYDDFDNWKKAEDKIKKLQVDCPYKTLIFDSLTSMADLTLRQTLSSKGTGGKVISGINVNTIEDYNAESSAIQELIALTKDIQSYNATKGKKINIILIAHVVKAEYRNTVKNETHISRQIVTAGKNVAAKIPAYCNEVYHFNIKEGFSAGQGKYSILTSHTGDDFARTGLDLDKEIVFDDKPLYEGWIKPAIDKLKSS